MLREYERQTISSLCASPHTIEHTHSKGRSGQDMGLLDWRGGKREAHLDWIFHAQMLEQSFMPSRPVTLHHEVFPASEHVKPPDLPFWYRINSDCLSQWKQSSECSPAYFCF